MRAPRMRFTMGLMMVAALAPRGGDQFAVGKPERGRRRARIARLDRGAQVRDRPSKRSLTRGQAKPPDDPAARGRRRLCDGGRWRRADRSRE
jgi:hypothetical protein